MRALIQRVTSASVSVEGESVGSIETGLLILLGVRDGDAPEHAAKLAAKIARLRVFEDEDGRMDRSLSDLGSDGAALCVSQFTLYGDTRRGLRPSFTQAARPEHAETLYEQFCRDLAQEGLRVEQGRFGAHMVVESVGDGPVTLLLEA